MKKIIQVMTFPLGACGSAPVDVLGESDNQVRYNPFGRRLKPCEVADLVAEAHGLIAGTEPYTREVLQQAGNLQVLSRVGVGLDNVDLDFCREKGITVTYTPEAPADAVAELTVAQIINLTRRSIESDRSVRQHAWNRFMGVLLREIRIGILGVGRIGQRVARLLQPFQPQLFGCDIAPDKEFGEQYNITWMSREELFAGCDLVTVHVPLTDITRGFVGLNELQAMPKGGYLINTSRGPILDEQALLDSLRTGNLGGAALDVFQEEPYTGALTRLDNVILTAHIGSSARHSRLAMELQAAEDCVRVLSGRKPRYPVEVESKFIGSGADGKSASTIQLRSQEATPANR